MSDLVLYRKYRPAKFKDVLGQEQVVTALEAAVKAGNPAHAYIFAGSRGTGKTSIARIFAAALGTAPEDLYEIDAASNRGIDEIRAIREAVHTLPYRSEYKVYILDEAHMLTKDAWNALLKTLEEPPAHVIFILATTEPDRILDTVVSRCQLFKFRKPTVTVLKKTLENVAKAEGIALEPAGAELIAVLADGSFRDALSSLQQIIGSVSGKKIGVADVEKALGAPRGELLNDALAALGAGDANKGLSAIRAAREAGFDMKVFLELLIERVRAVLLIRFAKDIESSIAEEYSDADFAYLKSVAGDKASRIKADTLKRLLEASSESARASVPELPLELALIDLSSQTG